MSEVLRSAQMFAVVVLVSGLTGLWPESTAMSSTGVDRSDENPGAQHDESGLPARALLRIGTDNLRTGVIPAEIVFSPDGKLVASPVAWRGGLPEVFLFGVRGGRLIKRLRAPDRPPGFVQCLAFRPTVRSCSGANPRGMSHSGTSPETRFYFGRCCTGGKSRPWSYRPTAS